MRATEGHEGVRQRWVVYMRKAKAADSVFGASPSPSSTRSDHHETTSEVPGVNRTSEVP